MKISNKSEAYKKGVSDCKAEKGYQDNPYRDGTREYHEYRAGMSDESDRWADEYIKRLGIKI
jgi:hypothetical protein